jgi:hypothetical protein
LAASQSSLLVVDPLADQSGHPDLALPEVVEAFRESAKAMIEARREAVARAASRLGSVNAKSSPD